MLLILQLLACFVLWTVVLIAAFEVYACILRLIASLPSKLPLLLGYSLYCAIGGVIFVVPVFLLELILGPGEIPGAILEAILAPNQPQIAIGVSAIVYVSPILAYWFFQRRHMASLKELGYFLSITHVSANNG
jgi:hypothetical protein